MLAAEVLVDMVILPEANHVSDPVAANQESVVPLLAVLVELDLDPGAAMATVASTMVLSGKLVLG